MVIDPVTGIPLTFLTSSPAGDSKIYQTHRQWTADGKWVVFRSHRSPGQAFAVNEATGAIVQVTETGYMGMLCLARLSMDLYIMRDTGHAPDQGSRENPAAAAGTAQARAGDGAGARQQESRRSRVSVCHRCRQWILSARSSSTMRTVIGRSAVPVKPRLRWA